jgi:hypothetical protein
MIGPLLLQRLRTIYQTYLAADDFRPRIRHSDEADAYSSITGFRELLLCCLPPRREQPQRQFDAVIPSLNVTVSELMRDSVVIKGNDALPFSDVVYSLFCERPVSAVLSDAFMFSVGDDREENALLAESPYETLSALRNSLNEPENALLLVKQFQYDLMAAWSQRPLLSFFIRQPNDDGYLTWWPEAKTPLGRPLPNKVISTPSGNVTCEVKRYEEDDEDGGLVRAFEWNAELRTDESAKIPDAVTYGMAYIFERDETGLPFGGVDALVAAADSVADTDVLQVGAFFDQHEDAEELLNESDVCFVWLWERRSSAPKGAGGECLRAAVADLKRRFRKLRVVVADVKPAQFISWTDNRDYPQIEMAKQEAIDAVLGHLDTLALPSLIKGEVRPILNNIESDPDAAMRVVSASLLESMTHGRDDEDEDIDSAEEGFQMVCGIWLTPDFSPFNRGDAPKPIVSHSKVDFDALHHAIDDLFPYGPEVELQVPNDTVDVVTLEMRSASRHVAPDVKYCRDFGHTLLQLAKVDTSEVLNIRPLWSGLHAMPNREAAPPPVLLMFVVSATDFAEAMVWFAGAGISFGLEPFDPLEDDVEEYDPRGTLPPAFCATLESLVGCPFEPGCIFELICADGPPARFGLS